MDEHYQRLLREEKALEQRLAKVRAAKESYERWTEDVTSLLGEEAPNVDVENKRQKPQTPIAEFEKAVRDLFGRVSAPLNRTEVYDELTSVGVVVGGKEPLNTVASRLSRMEGIINLKGHGYWAEDRPYEAAGHPESSASSRALFEGSDHDPASGSSVVDGETGLAASGQDGTQPPRDPDAE